MVSINCVTLIHHPLFSELSAAGSRRKNLSSDNLTAKCAILPGLTREGWKKKQRDSFLCLQSRPLTRYLPVRKDDFDLRAHIESAGHSTDTCYHLSISEKTCRGYLVKMGGKIKTWKKRWFVFDRNRRTLSYYAGRSLYTTLFRAFTSTEAHISAYLFCICYTCFGFFFFTFCR